MSEPVCLADFEALARAVLPVATADYVGGGSGSESTVAANRRALDAVEVYPRLLAGAAADPRITLFDTNLSMPIVVAPMAYQRMLHPEGELAMASAAARAGVPMALSTLSSCAVEEVAKTGVELWFQLYWVRERALLEQLIDRAEAAGCRALIVTIDLPVLGRRLRDLRNAFHLPADVIAANLVDPALSADEQPGEAASHTEVRGRSALAAHTADMIGPALTWDDLVWLRSRTSLPLIVKGVLDPRDAVRAEEIGADGVVVSNHGGRQLDGAPASIDALPLVVEAVEVPVLMDSGIRSGTDVLRALALGAQAVLIGRPLLWALALGAATPALELLRSELTDALTLAGCPRPADATSLRTHRRGTL